METNISDDKNSDTANDAKAVESLGKKFNEARNKMGKSVLEVANHLNLNPHVVEDIENDDYSNLASDVYAKGYLRTYAKFVQLSETEILEQYAALNLGKSIIKKQPQLITEKPPLVNPRHQKGIIYGALGIFLVVFIYWWTSGATDTSDNDLLVLEEKKAVTLEPVIKEKKTEEKLTQQKKTEDKVAENQEKNEKIEVAKKDDEAEIFVEEIPSKPLIVSPEDVLSG